MRKENPHIRIIDPYVIIGKKCVSFKKEIRYLLLKYSSNFILFLDDCSPLTLFVTGHTVVLYLLKTVSNTRIMRDNLNMFYC